MSDKLEGLSNYKLKLEATGREMIGKEGGRGSGREKGAEEI